MYSQTSFDKLTGKATRSCDGGQVQPGDEISTNNELWPFLAYLKAMHSIECTIATLITACTLIPSKAQPEVSKWIPRR